MTDSKPTAIEPEAIAYARGLLKPPIQKDAAWSAFGAGALLCMASLGLAVVMLTGPAPGALEPTARAPITSPP